MEIFKPKDSRRMKLEPLFVLVCVVMLLQIYQISNSAYANYQLKKDPTLRVGELAEDFCYFTTKSLIDGSFTRKMFDEVTYKGLKAESNYFNFKDDEVVKLVKVVGDQCRVLTSSNGRIKGLIITLNKSIKNPLYYKAIQINEEDEVDSAEISQN